MIEGIAPCFRGTPVGLPEPVGRCGPIFRAPIEPCLQGTYVPPVKIDYYQDFLDRCERKPAYDPDYFKYKTEPVKNYVTDYIKDTYFDAGYSLGQKSIDFSRQLKQNQELSSHMYVSDPIVDANREYRNTLHTYEVPTRKPLELSTYDRSVDKFNYATTKIETYEIDYKYVYNPPETDSTSSLSLAKQRVKEYYESYVTSLFAEDTSVKCEPEKVYFSNKHYRQVSTGGGLHDTMKFDKDYNIYDGHTTLRLPGGREVHVPWKGYWDSE